MLAGMFVVSAGQAPGIANISETRLWRLPFPVDVRLTLSAHGRGSSDPTFQLDTAGAVWRTSLTPDGPATIRVLPATPDDQVTAHAWGAGAAWLLDSLPAQLGAYDNTSGFDPATHPVLRDVARRHPGLRVGRTGRLMEALVPAILEQKVVSLEAHRAWKILLGKYGTAPPGPAPRGMRVFPPPRTWRSIPSWDWHKAGVEGVRAQTIIRAATVAGSLERLLTDIKTETGAGARTVTERSAEAARKLRTLPGIGPWTAAETLQRAAGDPDAVSVGDYNLPKAVGWALARREKTDDAQMLELLEPYRGHRYRVTRLVELTGLRPPRRGPRMPVRDYRTF
jgi:3-methyladenine DNA glycosylase/8-oxoguanine DNA glycosylase